MIIMNSKFIFFDAKRNFVINFFIICQMALWILLTSSLLSLISFNNMYLTNCELSFPADKSASLELNDLVGDIDPGDALYNTIHPIIETLESNGYKISFRSSSLDYPEKFSVPLNVVHADKNDIKADFSQTEGFYNSLTPYYMNDCTIETYKKNIVGTINLNEWNQKSDIPVILGSNYAKKNNIGDKFKIQNKSFKIVGFFKKDTFTTEETSITNGTYSLNGSFVIPMDEKLFLRSYKCQPIMIYSKDNINIDKLKKIVRPINKKIGVSSVRNDFDTYFSQLKCQENYKLIRLGVISILIICSLMLTLSYEIYSNKDRIGILFSLGITKNKIFLILSYEFSLLTILGLIIGSIFYFKFYKLITFIYINKNLVSSLYISIAVLILILFLILRLSFNLVNKLTPKEMIGGFIE